ncbi:hypothetical protein [Shewanella sp. Bg11-22]|uniref:hypothetical protein n=1 Tax=Shewanella sp. Bg11-22 TaxID=2058304 RepID=UPI0012FF4647|nr:hypothetical protein [Shewanella sp. Bg11-22]
MSRKKLTTDQTTSIPLVFGAMLLLWVFYIYVETDDIRYLIVYSLGTCKLIIGTSTYQALCKQDPRKVNLWCASYYVLFRII